MGAVIQFCHVEVGHSEAQAGRLEASLLPAAESLPMGSAPQCLGPAQGHVWLLFPDGHQLSYCRDWYV